MSPLAFGSPACMSVSIMRTGFPSVVSTEQLTVRILLSTSVCQSSKWTHFSLFTKQTIALSACLVVRKRAIVGRAGKVTGAGSVSCLSSTQIRSFWAQFVNNNRIGRVSAVAAHILFWQRVRSFACLFLGLWSIFLTLAFGRQLFLVLSVTNVVGVNTL